MEEFLRVKIGADIVDVTKSISQMETELKDLGKRLKTETGGAFIETNREIEKLQATISALKNVGRSGFDEFGQPIRQMAASAEDATKSINLFQGSIVGLNQRGFPTLYEYVNNRRPQLDKWTASMGNASQAIDEAGTKVNRARPSFIGLGQTLRDAGNFAIDARIGFLAISNNIPTIIDDFRNFKTQLQATQKETVTTGAALRQFAGGFIGPSGLVAVIGLAATAIPILIGKFIQSRDAVEKSKKSNEDFADSIKDINERVAGEAARVTELVAVLRNENETRERKKGAINELKRLNSAYFGQLREEKGLVIGLDQAYTNYIANLFNVGKAQAASKKVQQLFSQLLEIDTKLNSKDLAPIINPQTLARIEDLKSRLKELGIDVTNLSGDITNLTAPQSKLLRQYTDLTAGIRDFDLDQSTIQLRKQRAEIEKQILALSKLTQANSQFVDVSQVEIKDKKISTPIIEIVPEKLTLDQNAINDAIVTNQFLADNQVEIPLKIGLDKNVVAELQKIGEVAKNALDLKVLRIQAAEFKTILTEGLAQPLGDLIFNFLDQGKVGFKEFADAAIQSIKRIIAQIIASKIIQLIGNALFPGAGTAATAIGKIAGSFAGLGGVAVGNIGGALGTGGLQLAGGVSFRIQGTDLVAVMNNANASIGRVG